MWAEKEDENVDFSWSGKFFLIEGRSYSYYHYYLPTWYTKLEYGSLYGGGCSHFLGFCIYSAQAHRSSLEVTFISSSTTPPSSPARGLDHAPTLQRRPVSNPPSPPPKPRINPTQSNSNQVPARSRCLHHLQDLMIYTANHIKLKMQKPQNT